MNKYYILHSKPSCAIISENFMQNRIDAQFYSSEYLTKEKIEFDNGLDYVELGEIGTNFSYGTPPYGHICDKGVPYLRIPDIEDDFFLSDSNIAFIDEEYHLKNIRNEVKAGDILFRIKGQLGQALVVPQKLSNSHTGSSFLRFTPKSINPYFLVCYLNSSFGCNQINRKQSNSIIQYLNIDDITSIRVPIPSPEIQKYIGDKVRKAEELREEAKRLKKEAETFLYEMIQLKPLNDFDKDMFSFVNSNYIDSERLDSEYYKTKYITLEKLLKSKKVTSFKDIIIESKYGASVPADYTMVGIPFIRGNNLTDNEINIDDIVYLNKKLKDEVKEHHVNTGDILITRSGTVGISAVVDEKCDGFSFGSFMIKLRIDMRIWNPYYIAAFLNSFWGKWQIERLQNGAVQQNINLQEIGRIIIPIISKENQDKIEELIKNYINKKRQSKQLIQEAKQEVEDLIEGNFDMSKVRANS
jgi:restriction endonuclease S subunit